MFRYRFAQIENSSSCVWSALPPSKFEFPLIQPKASSCKWRSEDEKLWGRWISVPQATNTGELPALLQALVYGRPLSGTLDKAVGELFRKAPSNWGETQHHPATAQRLGICCFVSDPADPSDPRPIFFLALWIPIIPNCMRIAAKVCNSCRSRTILQY